jgi:hypothetical protein
MRGKENLTTKEPMVNPPVMALPKIFQKQKKP